MLTSFWEKAGEGLAGLWSSKVMTLAAAFWGVALLAWAWRDDFAQLTTLIQNTNPIAGVALLIGLLFLLVISAEFARRIAQPVLRCAEGYWPSWLERLRSWLAKRIFVSYDKLHQEWEALDKTFEKNGLSAEQARRYVELDIQLSAYPLDEQLFMPTSLGNRLRAAEEYPQLRYGLEADLIWPRLWLVLPDAAREELTAGRQSLDESTQMLFWGILSLVWVMFAWWVVVPALVVCIVAWWQMSTAAERYNQLLRAAFDLYRFDLYKSLHWPLPKKPIDEYAAGVELSQYLRRNKAPQWIRFASEEAGKQK